MWRWEIRLLMLRRVCLFHVVNVNIWSLYAFFFLFVSSMFINLMLLLQKKMETWETGNSWQLRPWAQEEMTENERMNSPNPSELDLICFWKGSENGNEPSLLSLYRGQGVTTNKCTSHSVLWREGTAQNKVEVKWNGLRCRLVYQKDAISKNSVTRNALVESSQTLSPKDYDQMNGKLLAVCHRQHTSSQMLAITNKSPQKKKDS